MHNAVCTTPLPEDLFHTLVIKCIGYYYQTKRVRAQPSSPPQPSHINGQLTISSGIFNTKKKTYIKHFCLHGELSWLVSFRFIVTILQFVYEPTRSCCKFLKNILYCFLLKTLGINHCAGCFERIFFLNVIPLIIEQTDSPWYRHGIFGD